MMDAATRAELRPTAREMIDLCEKQVKLGDYRRAILALKWCETAALPLPDWLMAEAEKAMVFYFQRGGADGPGRGGGHRAKLRGSRVHMERHKAVDCELAKCGIKEEAYRRAHAKLKGTPYQGEPRQMQESYDKVEAELLVVFPDHGK